MYGIVWVCDPQLRPLRPGASLAGTFARQTWRVFVGPSLPECPWAPCIFLYEHVQSTMPCARRVYTHTHTFTQRNFYTQKLLHREVFHTDGLYTEPCHRPALRRYKIAFCHSVWRSTLISCEKLASELAKLQFYILHQFRHSALIWCERGTPLHARQNSAFHHTFVRPIRTISAKGCVS